MREDHLQTPTSPQVALVIHWMNNRGRYVWVWIQVLLHFISSGTLAKSPSFLSLNCIKPVAQLRSMWVPRWAQVSFRLHTGFGCQEEGSHSGGNAFRGHSWSPSVLQGFAAPADVTSELAVSIHAVAVIYFFSSQTMNSSAGMLSSFYNTIVERMDDRSSGREVLCSVLFCWVNICRLFCTSFFFFNFYFIYLFIFSCVGSSFPCKGFL